MSKKTPESEWAKQRARELRQSAKNSKDNTKRVNKVVRIIGRTLAKAGWRAQYFVHDKDHWEYNNGRVSIPWVKHKESKHDIRIALDFVDVDSTYPSGTTLKCRMRYTVPGNYPARPRTHSLLESKTGFKPDFIVKGILEYIAGRMEKLDFEDKEQQARESSDKLLQKLLLKKEPLGILLAEIPIADKVRVTFTGQLTAAQARVALPQLRKLSRQFEKENRKS